MSKHVKKSHVRDAVHMYLVNWGAMLTETLSSGCDKIPTYVPELLVTSNPREEL